MSSRLDYPKVAPAAYQAMMGLEKYLEGCSPDAKLMHLAWDESTLSYDGSC